MCAVATNLIRVRRPAAAAGGITIIAYYFDPDAATTGRLYAYEYNVDGSLVSGVPYQVDTPTLGVFTDFQFTSSTMQSRGDLIYDGSPALIVYESGRGSVWIWRPKSEITSLDGRIWYNTSPGESAHLHANGSIYTTRRQGGAGVRELLRLNLSMELQEVVSVSGSTSSGQTLAFITEDAYCIALSQPSFLRFPLSGATPEIIELAPQNNPSVQIGVAHGGQSILPLRSPDDRFPRIIEDDSTAESYLWPNEPPWLRLPEGLGFGVRVQSSGGYLLASQAATGGRRAIMGLASAVSGSNPLLDFVVPQQELSFSTASPFLIGIGSL